MPGMLTVKQLKQALKNVPDDTIIILGDDDELNGVHNAWYAQKEKLANLTSDKRNYEQATILQGEYFVHLGKDSEDKNRKFIFLIS